MQKLMPFQLDDHPIWQTTRVLRILMDKAPEPALGNELVKPQVNQLHGKSGVGGDLMNGIAAKVFQSGLDEGRDGRRSAQLVSAGGRQQGAFDLVPGDL